MHKINEYDADKVMEFIELHTGHGPVIRHLQDMHKVRDDALFNALAKLCREEDEQEVYFELRRMNYGT
jgi:hypothetical protein